MATENVPEGELGQIGPHAVPGSDAAFVAQSASEMAGEDGGTVSGVSYEAMSHNPPNGDADKTPYDTFKHSGREMRT